jgi:hypothetical protein
MFLRITHKSDAIAINVDVMWVKIQWTAILIIQKAIPIVVIVAGVPNPVPVSINLVWIRRGSAVVTGITNSIAVSISLVRVVGQRTVVGRIWHTVVVIVAVTGVSLFIAVGVSLVSIRGGATVVDQIVYAVTIIIVTRITDAISVFIGLIGICDLSTIIPFVGNLIPIDIGVTGIAVPVAIGILLARVGNGGAVVYAIPDPVAIVICVHSVISTITVSVLRSQADSSKGINYVTHIGVGEFSSAQVITCLLDSGVAGVAKLCITGQPCGQYIEVEPLCL